MDIWSPVDDEERHGIAIYNFYQDANFRIKLTVGEKVVILEKNNNWYLGHSTNNPDTIGIFPKAYIHFLNPTVDNNELENESRNGIIEEVISVLREWGLIWQQMFVKGDNRFYTIKGMIHKLILYHRETHSGMLSKYYLQELKQNIASFIDRGNRILGLDMVVRDDEGNILNPNGTSTTKLYLRHQLAAERIRKSIPGPMKNLPEVITHHSYALFVSVMNFVCILDDDVELLLMLYDFQNGYPITENFVFLWRKSDYFTINSTNKLKVMFSDLTTQDLEGQLYLVCYAIKIGDADLVKPKYVNSLDEPKHIINQKKQKQKVKRKEKRRPFGVSAVCLTSYLNEHMEDLENKHLFLPFYRCNQGNLDNLLKRLILLKESAQEVCGGEGLWVELQLMHGDINEVYRKKEHLKLETAVLARKMGFPGMIYPNDVRNELYLTLIEGDFSRISLAPNRNVEVSVYLCNENGKTISDVITMGAGVQYSNEYNSVIYYHDNKPRWMETFKIKIPYFGFRGCHLKFTFTHRSPYYATEKPFTMCYINIMKSNGTTLSDGKHNLMVYKIDHSKYEDGDNVYLNLPAEKVDVNMQNLQKLSIKGLSYSSQNKFIINTYFCSTKLTQNVNLVCLLNWMNDPEILEESLRAFLRVDSYDIVKFLQDILDALFSILMKYSSCDMYDNIIFRCLLYVFNVLSEEKYKHFQPILDLYIQESFCATLAYWKLIAILKQTFENFDFSEEKYLLLVMEALQYFMKFITRSRQIYLELNHGKCKEDFEEPLKNLLNDIGNLLCFKGDLDIDKRRNLLKYLYPLFPEILKVFDSKILKIACTNLSIMLAGLIKDYGLNNAKSVIIMIFDIIHSRMFLLSDCRNILMQAIMEKLIEYLLSQQEVELCLNCLCDLLELIFEMRLESSEYDNSEMMLNVLRAVLRTIFQMDKHLNCMSKVVTMLIAILRQMKPDYFMQYINHFSCKDELLDFLMEILISFKELVTRPVYSRDWSEMILLQNSVILKTMKNISFIIRNHFLQPFEHQIWNNYFYSAIAFITQPSLQLEYFSEKKRSHILTRYKDMRRELGYEIRIIWSTLGENKMKFIPDLVGTFLEMTLVLDTELREATLPIFFDMAKSEFLFKQNCVNNNIQSKQHGNPNFIEFEKELINKIDILIEGGKGDESYMELFHSTLSCLFKKYHFMKEEGIRFVTMVKKQLEFLLIYRAYINDDNKDNVMLCTYNLLNFYHEINHKEIYVRYVNKLCELHLESKNYVEAAITLGLYCDLLDWSDEPLSPSLRSERYPHCYTNFLLKESVYYDIIDFFDKGKIWSYALDWCKELCLVYENEVHDYLKLSLTLMKMSEFYESIMSKIIPEREYFCVAYYGRAFPPFLQNKVYIYQGKKYEKEDEFCNRIRTLYPKAKVIYEPPGKEIRESFYQYLQIFKVCPVFDEKKRFLNLPLSEPILHHLLKYNVQKFSFSVPLKREVIQEDESSTNPSINENTFMNLWQTRTLLCTSMSFPGVLTHFPVVSTASYEISPLQNVIDQVKRNNRSIYSLLPYGNSVSLNVNHVCLKLNEIVEGSIVRDVSLGMKAFVAEYSEYAAQFKKLKGLLVEQISLLNVFINHLGPKTPDSILTFMKNLQYCLNELPTNLDEKDYFTKIGKATEDVKENEAPPKSLIERVKSLKRKGSFIKKIKDQLTSYENDDTQRSNSQFYVPSPKTPCSASTLSSLNFTYELNDTEMFYKPGSMVRASESLPTVCFINSSQVDLDNQSFGSCRLRIFEPKVETKTASIQKLKSKGQSDNELYLNSKKMNSYGSNNENESLPETSEFDDSEASVFEDSLAVYDKEIIDLAASEVEDGVPPPLPPKERDYVNLDGDVHHSSSCWNHGLPTQQLSFKPLPPEPLEATKESPPPLPRKSLKKHHASKNLF